MRDIGAGTASFSSSKRFPAQVAGEPRNPGDISTRASKTIHKARRNGILSDDQHNRDSLSCLLSLANCRRI